jgi:poly(3-hydroxybutyrate) depolymerase
MRKTLVPRFIVPAVVVSVALGLIFNEVEAADPEVVSTWKGGIHFLPASATRSGNIEDVSFKGESLEQWARRLTREVVKPGVKIPAVIYAHGCTGPGAAPTWAVSFNDFGFAFFAPDSFRRPGRVPLCYKGDPFWKFSMRQEEIRFALKQIRKLDWIDQRRIVLVGKSEGGGAVADYDGDGFIAHIIMANDCKNSGGSSFAPSGVAVLNLVGANDRGEDLCSISREVGGSTAISLPGQAHVFEGTPEAISAVAKFLKACCGYRPTSATSDLDPGATAKKLVEELGELATLDAMLKADEAAGKGDEEGRKFWMRVHEIAMNLTGG